MTAYADFDYLPCAQKPKTQNIECPRFPQGWYIAFPNQCMTEVVREEELKYLTKINNWYGDAVFSGIKFKNYRDRIILILKNSLTNDQSNDITSNIRTRLKDAPFDGGVYNEPYHHIFINGRNLVDFFLETVDKYKTQTFTFSK